MKRRGFTLVEIMIVVAIIALLAAIAIPNLLRAKMAANDALAQSTLRTMSTAAETYATSTSGTYPATEADLVNVTPAYLNKAYCATTIAGFGYGCTWTTASYNIRAHPVTMDTSGTTTFSIRTGGILTPD